MDGEGFILIGGKSSRMGKDKFTLSLKGKTFLEIAFENLQKAQLEKVSVVVKRSESLAADGLNIDTSPLTEALLTVTDIYQNRGPLGGIHSALVHSKAEFTIILACDYPFISVELIEFLMNIAKIETKFEAFAPIQADGKIQSLCAIYKTEPCRKILSEMLENETENYSVRDFLDQVETRYLEFGEIADLPNAENFFFNVNTPEDFILATRLHEKNTKKE